jgi:CRISPR-associated exonuclease Cas4
MEIVVAISAIEHYDYCPRQCALVHVDGVWDDNAHTVRGELGHERADTFANRLERGVRVARAVPLWSEALGLSGRADAVEFHDDGSVVPVEYKIGTRHGDAAHLQLAAQALCLEEMLQRPVNFGAIWFSGPRRRHTVPIDSALRVRALDVVESVRSLLANARLPDAVNDERCRECQLLGYCLPGVVSDRARVTSYLAEVVGCAS